MIIHHYKDPVFKQPVMMESRSVFLFMARVWKKPSFLGQKGLFSGAIVGFGECKQHLFFESNLPMQPWRWVLGRWSPGFGRRFFVPSPWQNV